MYRRAFTVELNSSPPTRVHMLHTQHVTHSKLADTVGPFICLLKTHADVVKDFTEDIARQLMDIASKHKFVIMEDRYVEGGERVAL